MIEIIYDSCQEKLDFINSACAKIGIKYEFDIIYQKNYDHYEYALTITINNPVVVFSCIGVFEFNRMLHAFCQAIRICSFRLD